MGKASEEPFWVYDIQSNTFDKKNSVKGSVIPPLSHHSPPPGIKSTIMEGSDLVKNSNMAFQNLNKFRLYNPNLGKGGRIYDKEIEQKETEINPPKLIEHFDYRSLRFGKTAYYSIISNQELERLGGQIYQDKIGLFRVCRKQEFAFHMGLPIPNTKKEILIVYNPKLKHVRIIGKKCVQEPLKI
mgnify:FL=1